MKTLWLSLCAGLVFAVIPCPAQEAPAGESAPLLFVYVAKFGENASPRIALGLEKPALKISAFEKVSQISTMNPKLMGLAAQLRPDDAKVLIAAIKALGAPDAHDLPNVVLWFTTPDNKALDYVNTGTTNAESNLVKNGVLMFDPEDQLSTIRYLAGKLPAIPVP